jgi:hypothetical protein
MAFAVHKSEEDYRITFEMSSDFDTRELANIGKKSVLRVRTTQNPSFPNVN